MFGSYTADKVTPEADYCKTFPAFLLIYIIKPDILYKYYRRILQMIYNRPLTPQQQKKSQLNYYGFYAINGVSYMCLGETVILLLAVRINAPDYIVSTLGSMLYFGYLLLPLGKTVAAKRGGAYSQSFFWICRNVAAMMVAAAAVFSYCNMQLVAIGLLLTGAFFFYGFRAAGVVMSQPLVGEFTNENTRGKVLAWSNGIFFFCRLTTLIAITMLIKSNDSLWTLVAIIVFGSFCGITSSKFLRAIDETEDLRKSAAKPLKPELQWCLKSRILRGQLIAGFLFNFAYILIIPICTLAAKRGYNSTDADVMVFTLSLSAGASIMSFAGSRISKAIGPRQHMILTFILYLTCAFAWLIPYKTQPYIGMMVMFFILGAIVVWSNNAATHYFLQTIHTTHRVGGAILLAVISGVGSGVAGMVIAGLLLKTVPYFTSTPISGYRLYFFITAMLLLPGLWVFYKLPKLPEEKRQLSATQKLYSKLNNLLRGH